MSIIWACSNGHLEVIKYLLTRSDLTKHADNNDVSFVMVCEFNYIEMAVFYYRYENKKNKTIHYYFKKNNVIQQVQKLFEKRDFYEKINDSLIKKEKIDIKVKL